MRAEIIETDVLCIGGGIVGLMGAIRASELGLNVVVAEKGNTMRSGDGATGNDHFMCYIPEIQEKELDDLLKSHFLQSQLMYRKDFQDLWLDKSFDIVKLWESWGIPMKYKENYTFGGHAISGEPLAFIRYQGGNQKAVLSKKALKNGVKILNRIMGIELLRDGDIVGALGFDTREDRFIVFHCKSVILGTGRISRLYLGPTPAWVFNTPGAPNCTGDGNAMAFMIGADLVGGDIGSRHRGPKYFARSGQATWIGVYKDCQGNPIGTWNTTLDKRYSPALTEKSPQLLEEYAVSGRGPVYLDSAGLSDEDYGYMLHWLSNEGNSGLVNYMAEEGIDTRKNPIEFMRYIPVHKPSLRINTKSETSMKGLYSGGNMSNGIAGMAGAAIQGWIAGENAAIYAKQIESNNLNRVTKIIEEKRKIVEAMRRREIGASWQEVNIALQQIMSDYSGYAGGLAANAKRSESMLTAGLTYIRRLKQKAYETLMARNQHELMRCFEVLNLIEMGELVFIASNERKETRGTFLRSDYTTTDPLLDGKRIVLNKQADKVLIRWE